MADTESPWLSPEQAAEYIDMDVGWVYKNWRDVGIPFRRPSGNPNGNLKVHVGLLDAWMDGRVC